MLQTSIRRHAGRPTLFIDDNPHDGCMFWHSQPADAREDFERFANAGVHLFTSGVGGTLRRDGGWDTAPLDDRLQLLLAADADALFLPRIHLEPPAWWYDDHPDDQQVHVDVNNGDETRRFVVFASQDWRHDMGAALTHLIHHCEDRWTDHILGYHLCAGACGEWSYYWGPVVSGYAPVHIAAWRKWLRRHYDDDVDALRNAWQDTDAGFADAAPPDRHERRRHREAWPAESSWLDPRNNRRCIDFLHFHSQAVADAICHFCGVAKTALAERGREKICGAFYGYHIANSETPYVVHNAGHHAMRRVLTCRDLDFVAAPLNYNERHAGGFSHSKILCASADMHGKLVYHEDDTFTHRAQPTPWRPTCADADETANVLWRNLAGAWHEGGALWWMDHDGDAWYRDDDLMDEIAAMRKQTAALLAGDRENHAQIAVFGSADSLRHLRYDTAMVDALLPLQMAELHALGAPFDCYGIDDVAEALAMDRYRFVIFLDTLYLSPTQRRKIQRSVRANDRHVLWCHAAGLLDEATIAPMAMSDLMGIGVRLGKRVGPLRAETMVTGTRVSYGSTTPMGPEITGNDPQAETLGWSLHRGDPVLLRRHFADWTSIWSGVPLLPAAVLRVFARAAGVHIYLDSGDRVWRCGEFLVIHGAGHGKRRLTLPVAGRVDDLRGNENLAQKAAKLSISVRRGETLLLRLS